MSDDWQTFQMPMGEEYVGPDEQIALLTRFAEVYGLVAGSAHQPDGRGVEAITLSVTLPETGEAGEIMLPAWFLKRALTAAGEAMHLLVSKE